VLRPSLSYFTYETLVPGPDARSEAADLLVSEVEIALDSWLANNGLRGAFEPGDGSRGVGDIVALCVVGPVKLSPLS